MLITVPSITGHRSTLMVRLQLSFPPHRKFRRREGGWLVGDVIICGIWDREVTELDVDRWIGPIRVHDPASYGRTGRTLYEETSSRSIIDGSAENQTGRTSGAYVRLEGSHARSDRRDRYAWGCHIVPSRSGASGLEGFRGLRRTFSWDSHHVCIPIPRSVGPLLGDLL